MFISKFLLVLLFVSQIHMSMGKFGMGMSMSHSNQLMMSMTMNIHLNKRGKRSMRRELQKFEKELFDKTVSRCENIINSYDIFYPSYDLRSQADNHAKCNKIVKNLDLMCFTDIESNKNLPAISSEDSKKEDVCLMKSIRTKINSHKKGNGYDSDTTDIVLHSIQDCVKSFDSTTYDGLNQGDKIFLCLSLYNPSNDFTDILAPFYVPIINIVDVIFFTISIGGFIVMAVGICFIGFI